MPLIRYVLLFAASTAAAVVCVASTSGDIAGRTELKRAELSGAPGMEVISSVSKIRPGEGLARHFHHGIETAYVLEGAMVQYPGKAPTMLPTGTVVMNLRDAPHGGFTVVGEHALRLFTVHIVDKGKPLYEWVQ
jgi:quercetin dioxygenase-like cupin family protein